MNYQFGKNSSLLPLFLRLTAIGLRKSVSEYLMKHPVFNARPSDQGKHFNIDTDAASKQVLQELAFNVLQQFANT